ncbi:MAG: kynureninase [Oscillospiraceae bacterium]|nr:kynureninase [Oscillospiraceae bacterium]
MKFDISEAFAKELDSLDNLNFADRFYKANDVIYMDGNSLGLMPKAGEAALLSAVEDYKNLGIDGWTEARQPWFYVAEKLGARMAKIVGALEGEVVVTGSTTVNIHNLLATFYKPSSKRTKLLMDELNFPSDIYAAQGHLRLLGRPADDLVLLKSQDGVTLDEDDIIAAFNDDVALVLLPSVLYRSGQLLDIERLTAKAHEKGIIIGFDCCHSAGSIPHKFHEWDVDFAVWCCYKYLNGGPGSSAAMFINRRHHGTQPGLPGWFGSDKSRQFDMALEFEPAGSAGAWQTGTPHIFSMAPIGGSLDVFEEFGMGNVREKSLKMTSYLMFLIDSLLVEQHGFSIATPRELQRRGGHVALAHGTDAIRINACLKAHSVIPDFRFPNIIRLAPIALYNTYHEVWRVVDIIREIMVSKKYLSMDEKRGPVA